MQYSIILIGLAIYYLYQKVQAARMLEFEFGFPYQIQVQNLEIAFIQPVTLTNLTITRLNLRSVNLNFETEQGTYIGRVLLPAANYVIPGNTVVTIPVEVRIKTADLFRAFPDVRQQIGQQRLSVRYKGTVQAENVSIPLNEVFTLDRAFFNL